MNKIRRFFNIHNIPNLMYYIIIINVVVFVMDIIAGSLWQTSVSGWLTLNPADVIRGQVWRLVTFVFVLPDLGTGFINIVLWNILVLYFYYWIGSNLEQYWGSGKFTMYYLSGIVVCWICAFAGYGLSFVLPGYIGTMSSLLLNSGLFLAFATVFPNETIRIFLILPVKVKWLGIISFVGMALGVLGGIVMGDILSAMTSVAVLANYLLWFGAEWIERIRFGSKNKVRKAQFKSKIIKMDAKRGVKNYRHKCCVCGKTDESDPNMQFRYCVKCSGLKEYCMDHINNHTHS